MLTKDLLRYSNHKNQIRPMLIDPHDAVLLDIAEQLLSVFNSSKGITREILLDQSKEVIDGTPYEAVVIRGLEKLLLDRTEFNTTINPELIDFRQKLFTYTSQVLADTMFVDLQAYQEQVQKKFENSEEEGCPDKLTQHIYSDLPLYQEVIHFKPFSPENLLHRYNCAQIQGLLLRCDNIFLRIEDQNPAQLRQLCKYLRFHQLLAQIKREGDAYTIEIDGPLNLFYQNQKYGINLANFFPAILFLSHWRLKAVVHISKQKQYILNLDESCEIKSHYHQFLAYVPQEILLFQQTFQQKTEEWQIEPAASFVPLEGELYCFPDYTLKHISGVEASMELFHAWHGSHLITRLQQLENQKGGRNPGRHPNDFPFIVGVTKNLLKDPLIEQAVNGSAFFKRCGFIFREMPTTDKILPLLAQFVDSMPLFSAI